VEQLGISRGNAHTNLKELVNWGIVQNKIIKGERKEHYEAEKDTWKIFCKVTKERRRKEIEPIIHVLEDCLGKTTSLKSKQAKAFNDQLKDLKEFAEMGDKVFEKISKSEKSLLVKWLLKFI